MRDGRIRPRFRTSEPRIHRARGRFPSIRLPGRSPGSRIVGGTNARASTALRIAFVTPELQSLVRRTSLAEVAESLARTLRQEGNDVRVFLPWHGDLALQPLADLRSV